MLARSDQSLLSYGEYGLYDYHVNLLYSKLHQFHAPVRRIELGRTLSEYSGSGNVLAVQVRLIMLQLLLFPFGWFLSYVTTNEVNIWIK